ncbi:MRGRH protein, partial [Regulus satrapa]|nr:MRGRH protein [Regulus satrapa]
ENFSYQCSRFSINDIAFAGVYLAISLCGLAGNGVVMWFMGFHTKQSPFTVYILNLAVADFSMLILFLLMFLVFLTIAIFCISSFFNTNHYYHFMSAIVFLCSMFNLSSL